MSCSCGLFNAQRGWDKSRIFKHTLLAHIQRPHIVTRALALYRLTLSLQLAVQLLRGACVKYYDCVSRASRAACAFRSPFSGRCEASKPPAASPSQSRVCGSSTSSQTNIQTLDRQKQTAAARVWSIGVRYRSRAFCVCWASSWVLTTLREFRRFCIFLQRFSSASRARKQKPFRYQNQSIRSEFGWVYVNIYISKSYKRQSVADLCCIFHIKSESTVRLLLHPPIVPHRVQVPILIHPTHTRSHLTRCPKVYYIYI